MLGPVATSFQNGIDAFVSKLCVGKLSAVVGNSGQRSPWIDVAPLLCRIWLAMRSLPPLYQGELTYVFA